MNRIKNEILVKDEKVVKMNHCNCNCCNCKNKNTKNPLLASKLIYDKFFPDVINGTIPNSSKQQTKN